MENSNPYETKCRCKPGFSGPFCVAATATVTTTTATTTTPKTTTTISNVGDETNKATDIMTGKQFDSSGHIGPNFQISLIYAFIVVCVRIHKTIIIFTDCGKESARRGGSSQHVTGIESNTIDVSCSKILFNGHTVV